MQQVTSNASQTYRPTPQTPSSTSPYASAKEHLEDHLTAVVLRVKRHLVRYGQRLVNEGGSLDDTCVSLEETLELMRDAARRQRNPETSFHEDSQVQAELETHEHLIQQRLAQTAQSEPLPELPLEELRALFGLKDVELHALILAAAPSLSVDIARMMRFALGDFTAQRPTVGFLAELLASQRPGALTPTASFDPEGNLARHQLLTFYPAAHTNSHLHTGVEVPTSVLRFLQGCAHRLPKALRTACELHTASQAQTPESLVLSCEVLPQLLRSLRRSLRAAPYQKRILLRGTASAGRRTTVQALLAGMNQNILVVEPSSLPHAGENLALALSRSMPELAREARFLRAAILIRGESLSTAIEDNSAQLALVLQALEQCEQLVILTLPDAAKARTANALCAEEVHVPFPTTAQQRQAWKQALAQKNLSALPPQINAITRRLKLPVGAIWRAVAQLPLQGGEVDVEALTCAARAGISHDLDELAQRIDTSLSWEHVILPEDLQAKLQEIVSHAQLQEQVFEQWGFAERLPYGRGLSCLFSGPPGTGKTMIGALLGKELGKAVYRVDVSKLVSKYIGETEKNLSRLFAQARKAQAILLFDEADSLFAKRTQVKGSNDRFANMEVNYLLQQMESYDGITILTTNLLHGIDEAFLRRLRFRIDFPMPDIEARTRLWKSMLPPRARVAADIDFFGLAEAVELSGGHIKNAVLRAAFYAARAGTAIEHDHLFDAAVAEARETGHLVRG